MTEILAERLSPLGEAWGGPRLPGWSTPTLVASGASGVAKDLRRMQGMGVDVIHIFFSLGLRILKKRNWAVAMSTYRKEMGERI